MDREEALKLAKEAYDSSTTFLESGLLDEWEENERQFNSQHPKGSKYESDEYKFRSKLYRPKTRATIQANEADCAFAFFRNDKYCDIRPADDSNEMQRASAAINQEILQYRLTQTVPWYKIVVGGYQDASKHDLCIASTYWCYKSKNKKVKKIAEDPMTGAMIEIEIDEPEVLEDRPDVRLIPIENIRFDPAANWTDPLNSSPYLIEMIPMTCEQVLHRMETNDEKTGEPKWTKYTLDEIAEAGKEEDEDEIREGPIGKEDTKPPKAYDTVFVHRNFLRKNGVDWVFYTLGPEKALSDPTPAKEVFPHLRVGERPYVAGNTALDTHKAIPASGVCKLGRSLQREMNDLANLRMDNVKLGVVGRYKLKRTANIDYEMLQMNVSGGGILMDNPQTDMELLETKDATAGSYQEQMRLDADFGDISGAFSGSQMMSNRQMGETKFGVQAVSTAATKVGDYRIKTFAVTFVEPLLGQVLRLIQYYESDTTVLALAAEKARLWQRFGIDTVTDELLRQELTVKISVGLSATDPMSRVQRLMVGIQAVAQVAGPQAAMMLKLEELIPEIFSAVGYEDGTRFFRNLEEDPRIMVLTQQLQQMQQLIQTKQIEEQSRNQRMQELQDKKTFEGLQKQHMSSQTELQKTMMDNQTKMRVEAMKQGSQQEMQDKEHGMELVRGANERKENRESAT